MKLTAFVCLLFMMVVKTSVSTGQSFSAKQLQEWENSPEWIPMMDDTAANYFEVVAAFEAFWKNREMPVEEDDVLGAERAEREDEGFLKRLFRSEAKAERKQRAIRSNYAFEVKKYNHWKLMVAPWVQEDGTILKPAQQQAIWNTVR
ncbi:MAG TPA: hypothetical protein VFW78_00595 [Bacteroidia bacterium]|nr:hypothetical protein [Bacteroidia bacterium]